MLPAAPNVETADARRRLFSIPDMRRILVHERYKAILRERARHDLDRQAKHVQHAWTRYRWSWFLERPDRAQHVGWAANALRDLFPPGGQMPSVDVSKVAHLLDLKAAECRRYRQVKASAEFWWKTDVLRRYHRAYRPGDFERQKQQQQMRSLNPPREESSRIAERVNGWRAPRVH